MGKKIVVLVHLSPMTKLLYSLMRNFHLDAHSLFHDDDDNDDDNDYNASIHKAQGLSEFEMNVNQMQ